MKKKELNKYFDAIQIEEEDDIFFIANILNKAIYKDENGYLYCIDFCLNRIAFFNIKNRRWEPASKDIMRELDKYQKLNEDDEMKVFQNNPPFACFDEMEKEHSDELSKKYLKLRKETPHKVIGWLDKVNGKKEADDSKDLYYAALLNDISENQYDFSGDEMYLFPIFEDGTYLDFSSRGWGGVLAASRYEFADMAYSAYAFMYNGKKYPKKGFYNKEIISINISANQMKDIKKYVENFFELDDEALKEWYGANYLFDITELGFRNPEAIGKVEFISDSEKKTYDVNEVLFLTNEQELEELISYYQEDNDYSLPEIVVGDIDLLKRMLLKEKRIVLLIKNL